MALRLDTKGKRFELVLRAVFTVGWGSDWSAGGSRSVKIPFLHKLVLKSFSDNSLPTQTDQPHV